MGVDPLHPTHCHTAERDRRRRLCLYLQLVEASLKEGVEERNKGRVVLGNLRRDASALGEGMEVLLADRTVRVEEVLTVPRFS